jgi:hypothetical protein
MPRWRKATWAILIWTVLAALWIAAGIGAVGDMPAAGGASEEAARAVGAGIGVTFIIIIWFLGFIVLGLIWLMSRPKDNVVIYGPQGQQVSVSEKEAKRRVTKQSWTYQPVVQGETPSN